jgi:hypothetical protein
MQSFATVRRAEEAKKIYEDDMRKVQFAINQVFH